MAGLRALALRGLVAVGGARLARARQRGRAAILAYHGVDPAQDPALNADGFQVPPDVFVAQLDHLVRHYRICPLAQVVRGLAGEEALPDRAVALTFDDGYANNAEVVAPLLRARGLPATFFLTTGFLDGTHAPWWYRMRAVTPTREQEPLAARLKSLSNEQREAAVRALETAALGGPPRVGYPFMTWDQARALARQGFELAAHTVSHPSLAHESEERMAVEIADSVARVTRETGCAPLVFSYPYGRPADLTAVVCAAVRASGCRAAVTTTEGWNVPGGDLCRLRRLNVTGHHRGAAFAALVSGLRGWLPS